MSRRFRITNRPDGSTEITRVDLGCLGGFVTGVALFFGLAAIIALFQAQWTAFGILLLLCGICLPNLAKRRRAAAVADETQQRPGLSIAQSSVNGGAMHSQPASFADELAKLVVLHSQGALTDQEFQSAKAQLLKQDPR